MNYDYEINLKLHDKIRIGNDVVITVCRLGTKNTHFSFVAPRHISIIRQELDDKEETEILIEEVILKR